MSVRRDIDFPIHIPYTPLTLEERQQNKILLLLSQSNNNLQSLKPAIDHNSHYCCSHCHNFYHSNSYISLCQHLLASNLYHMSTFDSYLNSILHNDFESQKHHICIFCANLINEPFDKFLSSYWESFQGYDQNNFKNYLYTYLQQTEQDMIPNACYLNINFLFHRGLYLLSKALPLTVYDLRINTKPYQSYSRNDWFKLYQSTTFLIQIYNEKQEKIYNYLNILPSKRPINPLYHKKKNVIIKRP